MEADVTDTNEPSPSQGAINRRPATIHDVARAAGVSSQTVSRYMRGFDGMKPATRAKVQSAIDELGWRPNSLARALRMSAPTRILLFVHELNESGPSNIILAATRAAAAAGYTLEVVPLDADDAASSAATISRADQTFAVGAMAFVPNEDIARVFRETRFIIPLLREINGDGIEGEHAQGPLEPGITLVLQHLHELGHRKIFAVHGPRAWFSSQKRYRALHAAAMSLGVEVIGEVHGDWSANSGYDAALLMPQDATALIAANDDMAIGAMSALHDKGLEIPADVSVTGFDDVKLAQFVVPALTTVHVDFRSSGQIAIERLLELIESSSVHHRSQPVPQTLTVRDSTGRAPESSFRPG